MERFKSREDRDAAIEVLESARKKIKNGDFRYVCYAIGATTPMWGLGHDLKLEIMSRIHPHSTVDLWLYAHAGIPTKMTRRCGKAYRLRWIDSMIEELKA